MQRIIKFRQTLERWFDYWQWRAGYHIRGHARKLAYQANVWTADPVLRTREGRRFIELQTLLQEFLNERFSSEVDARYAGSQLLNVLCNCDSITYEEPGTAEAYALLHFLDRYHRFQMIFQRLHALKLMPLKARDIDILDIGTGPGPSMFATSDFYVNVLKKGIKLDEGWGRQGFRIDYVERSQSFRNWLHHFTEYVNYYCPSKTPWWVPFHHGTFYDFSDLPFNSIESHAEYDDDGDLVRKKVKIKHRFDLIVMSNFLTTKPQVQQFSKSVQNCARYLRHNGILIVVGAPARNKKYKETYNELSQIILQGNYSNRRLVAKCTAIDIGDPIMKYGWSDGFGTSLKSATRKIYEQLCISAAEYIPLEAREQLEKSIRPEYAKSIEWQVLVFKKSAFPRRSTSNFPIKRAASGLLRKHPSAAHLVTEDI